MSPTLVIEKLKSIGYQIRTDGDDIILTAESEPSDAKLAISLLSELRQCKTAVIDILKTGEWPATEKLLVEWFLAAQIPEAPFQLRQAEKVLNPEVFWASIKREIECGSRGTRARTGVLQADLKALRARFN